MGKKMILFLGFVILAGAGSIHAQSNQIIDDLLEAQMTSFGQAAYLVLTATSRISEDATLQNAASTLSGQDWTVAERAADEPLTLGEYAYLLMQAFDIEGGVMYRVFPGPRYASREFAYRKFIRGNGSPNRTFNGDEAIGILGRLLEWKEDQS
jgi:hypothetical protein